MLSVNSLRDAINQQLSDAESKRKLIESLTRSADDHEARGDETKAKLDRDSAERYQRDLDVIEGTIAAYQRDIEHRESKALEIDKRIDELTQRFEHDIQQLEDDKKNVKVAVVALSESEAARWQYQNMRISSKEEDVRKHYERELDRLQREKANLLG